MNLRSHGDSTDRQMADPKSADRHVPRLLAYVAELELEVDRLRRHQQLLIQEVRAALVPAAGADGAHPSEQSAESHRLAGVLEDLYEPPGYHPALDQVVAIAIRPLAEQVFRWQQRLQAAPQATLGFDLAADYLEWFPARLRHILDNLMSNALKHRDSAKTGQVEVRLGLRVSPEAYELRVSDNGVGFRETDRDRAFELFYQAAPARSAGRGVGLAVVKLLVEQSGGEIQVDSGNGQGASILVTLPRYPLDDFLI